jgi:hypothetical protein
VQVEFLPKLFTRRVGGAAKTPAITKKFGLCCFFHGRIAVAWLFLICNDKKENQIFLIYKEIQNGAVAKSYMTNGLLIYD